MNLTAITSRQLAIWAGAAIVAMAGFMALSSALDKPGDGNDPLLAEVGNLGAIVAFVALLGVAIVAIVVAVRSSRRS